VSEHTIIGSNIQFIGNLSPDLPGSLASAVLLNVKRKVLACSLLNQEQHK